MADETYNLVYKSDNHDVLAKSNVVIRLLRLLDQVADRLIAKLPKLFSDGGKAAGSAAPKIEKVAAALGAVQAAAGSAAPALQNFAGAANSIQRANARVATSTNAAAESVAGFTVHALAMRATREVFDQILDVTKELEQRWKDMAREASEFRDSLRELASLKGESGPNNSVAADVLSLSAETGMVPEKALAFSEAYENIGPTVRAKGHYRPAQGTPEDLERAITTEAAKTARRLGVDEKAAGEAIGVAGMFHAFASKEDAMEQLGGALKGLSEGKLAYGPGVRALSKGASILVDPKEAAKEGARVGKLGSFAEAGDYMGALSLGTGTADQAQMRMVQLGRVLNPDAGNEKGVKALKDAGLTDDMTDPRKLIQLSKYLKAKGVDNPEQWLADNNLGTVSTREKIGGAFKVADVLEQRLDAREASRKTNATGKATIDANAKYMATDRSASNARIEATESVLNKVEGIEVSEQFEKAKRFAMARFRMKYPGEYHGLAWNASNVLGSPATYALAGVSGQDYVAENQREVGAMPWLRREGKRVGIDIDKQFPGINSANPRERGRAFDKASDAVTKAGGDPLGQKPLGADTQQRIRGLRPGAAGGAPGVGGPQASNDRVMPGAELREGTQVAILGELRRLNGKVGDGAVRGPSAGPLRPDVDDTGNIRS